MSESVSPIRAIGRIGKRIYAFILVAILLYVFYLAVTYLINMVFYPTPVPSRLVETPGRVTAADLRRSNVPGVTEPTARAPFAHFHQISQWLDVDHRNGCTLSGCHDPLPHSKVVYVRSFTNFHATFLACQMCHEPPKERPIPAAWVSIQTGRKSGPPPLVRLSRFLHTQRQQIENDPGTASPTLVSLLQEIVVINNDPLLRYLQLEIATAEPGSPVWRDAVSKLAAEVPLESRGQYGAKIAPASVASDYLNIYERARQQAKPYFAAAPDSPERKRILDEIHANVLPKPARCLTCHGGTPQVLDFEALGYSPERAAFLRTNPVAAQVQSVREGRTFYLPRLSEDQP